MITGFDEKDQELSMEYRKLIGPIVGLLSKSSVHHAYPSNRIIAFFNLHSTAGSQVRKLMHHIRVNDLMPNGLCVLSSNDGYYASSDPKEIKKYVDSLKQRIRSMAEIVAALERQCDIKQINLFEETEV